jgi:phosphatidylglycerol---prolipoprotein diacylglyceryl transferase
MYALAVAGSLAAGSAVALPHFQLGSLDIGIPIQSFGVIVAAGVLIGAALLRRYAEWHGVSDEHIRGILGWITITGFLGAHWFDVLAYEPHKLSEPMATWPPSKWPVLLRIWDGISSYGGFVGGAVGFAIYVWWKRLPVRLFADISIVGLLPAFSIGRIGCTVVSDHVGAVVDKANWYAALAMDYPYSEMPNKTGGVDRIATVQGAPVINEALSQPDEYGKALYPGNPDHTITMWNLGLIEFLYLIPVNIILLWLAFRSTKRMPAGFIVVLAGILYAPVRFFLDYLRPISSDARHGGLTFAQWCSIIAFGVAVYAATRVLKNGKPAETVTKTSKEAQQRLKLILKEDEEKADREKEENKKVEKKTEKAVAAEKAAEKGEKKASGVADKKEEVPPTEIEMPALSKDIVKKSEKEEGKKEEGKKEEAKKEEAKKEEGKKEEAKEEKKAEEKAEEKKAEEKKADEKADDKKADDKK